MLFFDLYSFITKIRYDLDRINTSGAFTWDATISQEEAEKLYSIFESFASRVYQMRCVRPGVDIASGSPVKKLYQTAVQLSSAWQQVSFKASVGCPAIAGEDYSFGASTGQVEGTLFYQRASDGTYRFGSLTFFVPHWCLASVKKVSVSAWLWRTALVQDALIDLLSLVCTGKPAEPYRSFAAVVTDRLENPAPDRMGKSTINWYRSIETGLERRMTWSELPKVVQDYCIKVLPNLDRDHPSQSILEQAQTFQINKQRITSKQRIRALGCL